MAKSLSMTRLTGHFDGLGHSFQLEIRRGAQIQVDRRAQERLNAHIHEPRNGFGRGVGVLMWTTTQGAQ